MSLMDRKRKLQRSATAFSISPVMGGLASGAFSGPSKKPSQTSLPQGRTIVKGGMDTQAPGASGPDVTMRDSAMRRAIAAGGPITAAPAPARAPGRSGPFGGMVNAAAGAAVPSGQAMMQPAVMPGGQTMGAPTSVNAGWRGAGGRLPGYADGGKVYDRKPNGKRC